MNSFAVRHSHKGAPVEADCSRLWRIGIYTEKVLGFYMRLLMVPYIFPLLTAKVNPK